MYRTFTALVLILFTLGACDKVQEKTKQTINKGGEAVGKTATEFFEGVSEGVDLTLQCEITLSQELKDAGLETGKFQIKDDSAGGEHNLLVLYIIFNKDFNKTVSVKSFDKSGMESGRTKLAIEGKAGDAKYYDFVFDKRTYIESRSKLTVAMAL